MRNLRSLWLRLRGLFGILDANDEFNVELESHVAMHIEDGIRAGLAPEEARRQALIRLGTDPLTIRATRVDALKGLVDLMDQAAAAAKLCS